MKAIMTSMRVDWIRMTSGGAGLMAFYLLSEPVTLLLFTVAVGGGDADMPALINAVFNYVAGLSMLTFASFLTFPGVYQDMGGNGRMNGIMPAGRDHQVLGRYAYLAIFAGLFAVISVCSYVLAFAVAGQLDAMGGVPWPRIGALTFGYVLLASVALASTYRFKPQAIMYSLALGGSVVAILLFAAALRFPDRLTAILGWLDAHVFVSPWLTALLAVVIAAAVVAGSLVSSLRAYRRKDL